MKTKSPFISIIIVNYNGKHFLQNCLSSVLYQNYRNFEIIFVDNASSDGSVDFVEKDFPSVKVILSDTNLGFAGGNNLGYSHATGECIVLLNNDTIVEKDWLQGLVDAVNAENVAIASSLIKTEGIPEKYYEKNGSINFLGHNIMRVFDKPEDIFFAGGASLIYKKKILGKPFDDLYFAYGEDVWLSLRARFMGCKIVHTNNSTLQHFGSGTTKTLKFAFTTFYQERNRLLNTLLFFSPSVLMRIFPLIVVNCIAKIIMSMLPTKYSFPGLLKAYGWFIVHIPLVLARRKILKSETRVDEKEIIQYMSGKITNGESIIGKIINQFCLFYFHIVRIKTIELS